MEGFDELVIDSETSTPIHDNHFFKYRSLSNLRYFLDILVNKRLYMATYSELNDPMEGAYLVSGNNSNATNQWLQLLRSAKNDWRICSFSKNYNNVLMWSHYADSHKGCCIECEVVSKSVNIVNVKYGSQIPPINLNLPPKDAAKDVLSRKLDVWKYEDEVRVLKDVPRSSTKSKFLKIKIHKIYLGLRVSAADRTFFRSLIKSIDDNIQVVQMKKR